jgi:hypothetical protein
MRRINGLRPVRAKSEQGFISTNKLGTVPHCLNPSYVGGTD